ncbi:MAG: GAF domain-containing protein [Candidatus Omnitrophica bacterium]|nr:GAF domain-containing protein [Candidatus Omnitrophota bacterium]
MSIRIKLVSIFMALALIPLLFVSIITFRNYKNSLKEIRLSQLKDIAALKAERLADYFSGLQSNIEIVQGLVNIKRNLPALIRFAQNPSNPEFVAAKKTLDGQLPKIQEILGITDLMLVSPGGEVVYTSNSKYYSEEFGHRLPDYEWDSFLQGQKGVYLSEMFRNKAEDNKIEIMVSAPAFGLDGESIGVIVFEVEMGPVYTLIQNKTGLGQTGEILIGKKKGQDVIFLSDLKYTLEDDFNKHLKIGSSLGIAIQRAVSGQSGEGPSIDYRGKETMAAWQYIPSLNWGVVAKIDAEEAFANANKLKRLVEFILFIVTILGGVMAFSLARSIAKPIKKLAEGAKLIGAGHLDHKVAIPVKDEVGDLSRAFDKMTSDLKAVVASRDELNQEIADRKLIERALKWHEARNAILSDSGAILLASDDPQKIIDQICQQTMRFLNCQVFFNFLAMPVEKKLRLNAYAGIPQETAQGIEWIDYGVAVCGFVAQTGKRIIAEDILQTKDPRTDLVRGFGVRSYCCHPLLAGEKVLGTISFGSTQRDKFNEAEIAMMKATADMVAVALERNRALEAERRGRMEWERTFDSVPDLIAILDSEHRVVQVNQALAAKLGKKREECVGLACFNVIHGTNEPPVFCPHSQTLKDRCEHCVEINEPSLGGNLLVTTTPLLDDNGKLVGTVHVARDITEQKKAEQILKRDKETFERLVTERTKELMSAKVQLEMAKRLSDIGTLSATVAHELRNPLAAIGMAVENIRRKAQNPDLEKHLANIGKKITESDQIINNLLFYSRLKPPHYEAVNIVHTMDECVELAEKHTKTSVQITKMFDSLGDPVIDADPVQMREVFSNILNNACDALPGNGGSIVLKGESQDGFITVLVQDNGHGMSREHAERAFDPFFTTKAKGTGLGLAVCRQVVSFHGGTITIDSEPGKGTAVMVRLPRKNVFRTEGSVSLSQMK